MKRRQHDCDRNRLAGSEIEDSKYLSRRSFLLNGSAVLVAGTAVTPLQLALGDEVSQKNTRTGFTPKQERILTAVTEHLFPKGSDSPGATDINAVAYLESAIFRHGFKASTRNFIINRVQTVQEASMERFDLAFYALDSSQRETLLRYLVARTRWGKNWLSSILSYILEALLSDPVYGGNPDGIGWRWLEHQPGFPRPPADKIYARLARR